jgi:hypothetical protein
MLVPLYVLASVRSLQAYLITFFGQPSIALLPGARRVRGSSMPPPCRWVSGRRRSRAHRLRAAYMYIVDRRRRSDRRPTGSTGSANKWYFDELYNFLFVRGALGRPCCGSSLTWLVDKTIVEGLARIVSAWARRPLQSATSITSIRDADRRCRAAHLGHAAGDSGMNLAATSDRHHLPAAVGASCCCSFRAGEASANASAGFRLWSRW